MTSQQDIFNKLKAALPKKWFGDSSPLIDGVVNATAWAFALVYDNLLLAKKQLRIRTASDGILDMIAGDFFGTKLLRNVNESDEMYLNRIRINMFRERGTRKAVVSILEELTGQTPFVFEPQNPRDVGHLNRMYLNVGRMASKDYQYQAFVTAYRPSLNAARTFPGLSDVLMNLNQGAYLASGLNSNAVSDALIYSAIDSVRPYGTIIWVQIKESLNE